jgi:hypothetical protein
VYGVASPQLKNLDPTNRRLLQTAEQQAITLAQLPLFRLAFKISFSGKELPMQNAQTKLTDSLITQKYQFKTFFDKESFY